MFRFLPLISVKDITSQIFDAIVTPITSAVSKVISTVLDATINNVLIPALKPFFESIVEPILNLVGDVFLTWIHIQSYFLYVGVLKVIDILEHAFNIFSGASKVKIIDGTKEGAGDFLLNVFFTNSGISTIFRAITLLSFAVSLVFGIIAVMKSTADLDGKRPVGKVIGTIAKTGLTFLIIPFFTIFALNMTNIVIKKTDEILSLSIGEKRPSLGTILFLATTLEAEENKTGKSSASGVTTAEMAENLKNNSSSGDIVGFTDGVRADYYSGDKDYWDFSAVANDFNITQIKTVLGLFMSLFVALMLIICTFVFITRIFEVLILYIASPFFVATIPLDDGAKFDEWRNMFIAKLFSGFGMLIGMKLYIILVPIIMSSDLQLSSTNSINMGLKVLFIVGGAFAIYKSNSLLMQILNINASYGENATAAAGFGFVMSAKNMGMNALKGISPTSGSRSRNMPQATLPTSTGNKNPNLSTFSRASVSNNVTRNKNITIGGHRSSNTDSNKIQIGSHRNTWENGEIPSSTRNSNSALSNSHSSELSGSSFRRDSINKTQSNSFGSVNNKTATDVRKSVNETPNIFNSQSSTTRETPNTFSSQSSAVSEPSKTVNTVQTVSKEVPKNTWKKATPNNKKDEGNKF